MDNKVVVITGSSAGIGKSTAISFARLNCRLVIHGTNAERIKQVAQECLNESPKKLEPVQVVVDVRESDAAEKIIGETIKAYGQLDVLVNNAGLFQPCKVDSPNARDNFTKLMKINLDSAVELTIMAVPHLKKTKGCIVNISSNLHAKCIDGGFAYCTAKAALTMFTKSIAVDLAPEVRANSISPGPVATLMPTRCGMEVELYKDLVGSACLVNRVGEPEEIARLVVFLASPESAFITGSDFIIDGGSTIKPEGKVVGQRD